MTSICKYCGISGPAQNSKCYPSEVENNQRHEFIPAPVVQGAELGLSASAQELPESCLERYKFQGNIEPDKSSDERFPAVHFGRARFLRNGVVDSLVNTITKKAGLGVRYPSHYYRSLPGSGKTQLAKLVAVKLQEKLTNSEVFLVLNSSSLDKLDPQKVDESIHRLYGLGKIAVIIVDEAHNNPKSALWTNLLKPVDKNLIVIGFGVASLKGVSDAFTEKHEAHEICYSAGVNTDMQEVVDYWVSEMSKIDRGTINRGTIAEICNSVCEYTNGQAFAFLSIVELLLTEHACSVEVKDLKGDELVKECMHYMASDSFYSKIVLKNVLSRCFRDKVTELYQDFQNMLVPKAVGGLSVVTTMEPSRVKLTDLGFWSAERNSFFSPLLLHEVLKKVKAVQLDEPRVMIEKTGDKQKIIKQLIILGLSGMTEDNFFEGPLQSRLEDAISNAWAFYISACAENVSVAPQARGKKGQVDHVFNGDIDVAVESVLEWNDSDTGVKNMTEHCKRFGLHKYPWEHNAVLNFNMKSAKVILPSKECSYPIHKVFTYVHVTRQLFCGRSLVEVKGGVVPRLSSPNMSRGPVTFSRFSTLVAREAPKALAW
eukprot:CAMPEP_0201092108 /NCGR_PEP_ID=MMETSP0812-20130820/664_1 /ASSEMBLY_ACC=CAM_ASM_000668 /TAXON_ID=98059 /ORGANISM="Dinobryon sp., Strain UTEXLB2267" /LENGTH=598 /DNA_ID=CAMNT_0047343485 /DNA_START=111 /DNA_END=1904 /DNA_ORIENTATION=+